MKRLILISALFGCMLGGVSASASVTNSMELSHAAWQTDAAKPADGAAEGQKQAEAATDKKKKKKDEPDC